MQRCSLCCRLQERNVRDSWAFRTRRGQQIFPTFQTLFTGHTSTDTGNQLQLLLSGGVSQRVPPLCDHRAERRSSCWPSTSRLAVEGGGGIREHRWLYAEVRGRPPLNVGDISCQSSHQSRPLQINADSALPPLARDGGGGGAVGGLKPQHRPRAETALFSLTHGGGGGGL